jgi:AcrR family transcriptional regulator
VTRLAKGRTTHLSKEEIVTAALGLFDAGPDRMSYRNLAAELGVTTAAVYHHFPSRFDLVMAVVDLVWREAVTELEEELGGLVDDQGDPEEFLVGGAVAVRRAFGRHWRVAPYVVANAPPAPPLAGALEMMAVALERLGLHGDDAEVAFYAVTNYTLGAVAVTAARRRVEEELTQAQARAGSSSVEVPDGDDARASSPTTSRAIDSVFATVQDPGAGQAHEELFVAGLRSLMWGIRQR